ncbi:MAG: hypothetical protein AAB300_01780 [Nitrospirota bacterium]
MPNLPTVTFQEALEVIESLPEDQQEDIIDIIHRRLTEQRREFLSRNIQEAKAEYARGDIKKGTVEDLMSEIER